MLVDVEVAGRANLEVEQAVVAERREEVIVEADPRVDVGDARAVEHEPYRDVGLASRAMDGRAPFAGAHAVAAPVTVDPCRHDAATGAGSASSTAAAINRSFSSVSRTVTRR